MDDNDNNMNTQTDSKSHKPQPRVWRPGVDKMGQDEKLEYDNSAYTAYHKMNVEWPCLSFDIIPDALGMYRTKFPMTMYMAAGTQADQPQKNKVMLMKMSDIHKTYHGDIDDPGKS